VANDLIVKTGEELDALLSLRESSKVSMKRECALNGIPEEYHHRAWWLREMGIEESKVGQNMLDKFKDIGMSSALSSAPVLERLLMSRQERVERGESGKSE